MKSKKLPKFQNSRKIQRHEKSAKDGQIGAPELDCKIFVSSGVIFGFYEKITPGKKLCVSDTFEFFVNFVILVIFGISIGNLFLSILAK